MLHSQHTRRVQLLALILLCSHVTMALRHESARQTLASDSSCTGTAAELVLCERDSWVAAQQSQASFPSSLQGIPEVLHQVWFPSTKAMPQRYRDWQQTWINNHPGWRIWLWSDVTNKLLVARCNCHLQTCSAAAEPFTPPLSLLDSWAMVHM